MTRLHPAIASGLQKAWRLGELVCSEARKARLRAMYPGISVDRRSFVGPGCDIRVAKGGRIVVQNCAVTRHVTLTAGPGAEVVILGDYLGPRATIVARERVRIGRGTKIAEDVVIRDANHDHTVPLAQMRFTSATVTVGDDVWIGSGAKILSGVSIGDHSTVGAGAVVTRSIPALNVAVGVPATARPKTVTYPDATVV